VLVKYVIDEAYYAPKFITEDIAERILEFSADAANAREEARLAAVGRSGLAREQFAWSSRRATAR
jgi:hypothetical protein